MEKYDTKKLKEYEVKILDKLVEICEKHDIEYFLAYGTLLGAVRHKGFIPWDDDIDVYMKPSDYYKFKSVMASNKEEGYFYQALETEKYHSLTFSKLRMNNTSVIEEKLKKEDIHNGIYIDIFPLLPFFDDDKLNKKFFSRMKLLNLLIEADLKDRSKYNHYGRFGKVMSKIFKLIPRRIRNILARNLLKKILLPSDEYNKYICMFDNNVFDKKLFSESTDVEFEGKKYTSPKNYDKYLTDIYGDYMTPPPVDKRYGHCFESVLFDVQSSGEKIDAVILWVDGNDEKWQLEKNKYDKSKKTITKRILFIICILLLISSLIFFKYINFIVENVNNLFNFNFKHLNLVLPIGISFYTFQILSYIIDLYKNKVKVQKNFFNLALYVSFFPQLIAGPIVRYETIEEEITNRKETLPNVIDGTKRFIIGLSKKIIIANQMALFTDLIYNNYSNAYGTSIIWLATLTYAFQIYFDFSGYSDMAIGLGKIFGFNFLENFNYPYISTSITEFWRRWHISLSSWFKDYIYIPLGGNRVKKIKWIRNIIIVWMLTGLWHGAAWNFIIWGLFYGFFLIFEKLFFNNILKKLPKFICWIYAFFFILIGWLIFRINSMDLLIIFLKEMFIYNSTDWVSVLSNNLSSFTSLIFVIPAIIFSTPIIQKINSKFEGKIWYIAISNIILIILLIVCIVYLTSSSYNPFIYFRF